MGTAGRACVTAVLSGWSLYFVESAVGQLNITTVFSQEVSPKLKAVHSRHGYLQMQVGALSPSLLFLRITANVRSSSSQDDDAHTSRAATASLGTGRRRSGGVTLALLFANRRLGISTASRTSAAWRCLRHISSVPRSCPVEGGGCRSWRVSCWADSSPPSLPAAGSQRGRSASSIQQSDGDLLAKLAGCSLVDSSSALARDSPVDARADMAYSVSRISSCQASSRPQASWPPASSRPTRLSRAVSAGNAVTWSIS